MTNVVQCPVCGATWTDGQTCETYFHQLLGWEYEDRQLWVVHQLMVLCYRIQHPQLCSPDGLRLSIGLLIDFVENGLTTKRARAANRDIIDSGSRTFKITGTSEAFGAFDNLVNWSMTIADVVSNGNTGYIESVEAWARSVIASLKTSDNVPIQISRADATRPAHNVGKKG